MKLTNIVVIFLLISLPLMLMQDVKINKLESDNYNRLYIKTILENSADDAVSVMKSTGYIYDGEKGLIFDIDKERVFNQFIKSLNKNLNFTHSKRTEFFNAYIPLMLILDDEGYYINYVSEIKTSNGVYIKRLTTPLKRYTYEHNGNFYFLSLSGKITMLYRNKNGDLIEFSGTRDDILKNKNLGVDVSFLYKFDYQKTLKEILNRNIKVYINTYNTAMKKYGKVIDIDFFNNYNRIDDKLNSPTFIAFFMGYDKYNSKAANHIVKTRFNIELKDNYVGFEKNGIKYYLESKDAAKLNLPINKIFSSEIEAVKNGYYNYREK